MKRLKFSCPFGGKTYPMILAATAGFAAMTFSVSTLELPWDSALIAMALAAIVVLMLCFVWEQRLTPAEQTAIAYSPYPLWNPVTEDIVDRVRSLKWFLDIEAVLCSAVFLLFGVMSGVTALTSGEPAALSTVSFLSGFVILAADFFRNMIWRSIDKTAVYTFIPIDHMYDVTHHHKDGDFTLSYLVFYQPDGRYVLRARYGTGDYGAIAVVKFRGMITWVSVPRTKHVTEDGEII